MKNKTLIIAMLFVLLTLVACNAVAGVEPANETANPIDTPVVEENVVTVPIKYLWLTVLNLRPVHTN